MTANATELGEQLAGGDESAQATAAEQLAQLGEGAVPAALPLVVAASSAHDAVREWSVAALEAIGPPADEQVPQLVTLAIDSAPDVAYWAVTLLGRSGMSAAAAVPTLSQLVTEGKDRAVRQRAAWALGEIGPAASTARSVLEEATTRGDLLLSRLARRALEKLGDTS